MTDSRSQRRHQRQKAKKKAAIRKEGAELRGLIPTLPDKLVPDPKDKKK